MKIGFCLRTWGEKGGIGVYSRSLLKAMLALDSKNQYLLFFQDKNHLSQLSDHKNVREFYLSSPGKLLWDQMVVPFYAAREEVDILIHPKLTVPMLAKSKTVMVLHGSEWFVYPEFSYRSNIIYIKTIFPLYLRRASAIISVCENARKDVIRFLNIDPNKVWTIPLAADEHFRRIDDKALLRSVQKKYGLPERFILNVCLISPGKNISNLLRSLSLVNQHINLNLVIAGIGHRMFQDDIDLIEKLGLKEKVLLPGYIPHEDLVAVYNLADAVVFPSFYECFPSIPLQANACGCPVVTSHTGGTPEAAGDAALYINPLDVEDIAKAITTVLTDDGLREDLIEKGYQNVKRFTWETTARKTLDLLESLIS
jgi:glycosyltransferase involved in cell wall biosynthesis